MQKILRIRLVFDDRADVLRDLELDVDWEIVRADEAHQGVEYWYLLSWDEGCVVLHVSKRNIRIQKLLITKELPRPHSRQNTIEHFLHLFSGKL